MLSEHMGVAVEVWPLAADEFGIWLIGDDALRTPRVPADSEVHFEAELLLAGYRMPTPLLLHSTSWRGETAVVVLTYVAVLPMIGLVRNSWPQALPVSEKLLPEVGAPLPHGAAEAPLPRHVDILFHAIRHLRFLRDTDATARDALTGHWAPHLARLEPALAGMYLS